MSIYTGRAVVVMTIIECVKFAKKAVQEQEKTVTNREAMEKLGYLVEVAKEHTGDESVYEDAMSEQPVPTRIVCLRAEASDPRSKDAIQKCVECGELVLTAATTQELVASGAYGELQFICISCVAQDYATNGVAEIGTVPLALEHFKNKVRN